MTRRRKLRDELRRRHPGLPDTEGAIASGRIVVDGVIVTNPSSLVRPGASISLREPAELRGSAKLRAALERVDVRIEGRVALDVGAAAGGFTTVLLERGARRVYAVDVGHGQLRGSLRQDPRVANLEATNLADLTTDLVPDPIEVIAVDVSYLSLSEAIRQLDRITLAPACDLIGLVKPMFELRLPTAPTDPASLEDAITQAAQAAETTGWTVRTTFPSPLPGAKGATEGFLHAQRR